MTYSQKMERLRTNQAGVERVMSNETEKARGWSPLFQERLSLIINELGGAPATARQLGVKHDQIYRWRDGESKMPLYAADELCQKTGRSVDWLVGLSDSPRHSDAEIEQAIADAVPFAINMASYFDNQSPETIGLAAAKRVMRVLKGETTRDDQESA